MTVSFIYAHKSENYDIDNTVTVKESTYTDATANTLYADQSVSATGDAELHLEGEEGDNKYTRFSKRITLRDRMQMILLKFWMARYQQSLLQK